MTQLAPLYTIESVIAALGGTKAAADWAGIGMSAVSNWVDRGIPAGWHYRIDRELRDRGFEVHPSVFGYAVDQREGLRLAASQ